MDCTFEINAALSRPAFIPAVGGVRVREELACSAELAEHASSAELALVLHVPQS